VATTEAKLVTILSTLDDGERAALAAVGPETTRDDLSPALRARLEAAVIDLTDDDRAEITAKARAGDAADEVEGFGLHGLVEDHRSGWNHVDDDLHKIYDAFSSIL
jgi:hypothetical protein